MSKASLGLRRPRALVQRLLQKGVIRSLGVLVGGTVVAHTITALAMPISTRLFTPADFAAAAAFSSLVGIFSVVACLRFDLAIALPEDDAEAVNLLALSLLVTVGVAALTGVGLILSPAWLLDKLNQPKLIPWLWLLPTGVLIGGAYLALQMWFVRCRDFPHIARSRILQSLSAASGQVSLGFAGYAPLGLIIGQLLNYGAGSIFLFVALLDRDRDKLRSISFLAMATAFLKYRRFPIFSTWEALANAASNYAPMLLIAALAHGPEAGYLTLAIFLLQMPMALLGNSIGQLFVAHAPQAYREQRLSEYITTTITNLARATAGPITLIAVVSPSAFGFVFGHDWWRAGALVAWMAPWFFMQLLAVPVSTALHIVNRQSIAMTLQAVGFVLRLGAVLLAARLFPDAVSESYAISGLVFYALYLYVICYSANIGITRMLGALCRSLPYITAGGLMGGVLLWLAPKMVILG